MVARDVAKLADEDAIVTAVGRPAVTSLAKVGPDRTAVGISEPKTFLTTSLNNAPFSLSKPLVAQAIFADEFSQGSICRSMDLNAWLGGDNNTTGLKAMHSSRLSVTDRFEGNFASGR